jgi:hypothetical protein
VEVTLVTLGEVVSMTIALAFEIEPAPPGVGRVRVALLDAASRMVPEFNASAEVLE